MDKSKIIPIIPAAAPIDTYHLVSPLNHGVKSLHTVNISSKSKPQSTGKEYVSKEVSSPAEFSIFHDTTKQRSALLKALTRELNESPSTSPILAEKITIKNFLDTDSLMSQRLYSIVQKLCPSEEVNNLYSKSGNKGLYDVLDGKICKQLLNGEYCYGYSLFASKKFFRNYEGSSYPREKIIADFERIERNVLEITPKEQQERYSSMSRSETPITEMSISPMTISNHSEESGPSPEERVEEVRKKLLKSVNDYIVQTGIELIVRNTPIVENEQNTREKVISFLEILKEPRFDGMTPADKLKKLLEYSPEFSSFLYLSCMHQSLFEGYIESCLIAEEEEFTNRILERVSLNMPRQSKELLLQELMKAGSFPINRTIYLKESADAQKEVCAQEIIRALCPTVALLNNPYPKHRVTQIKSKNAKSLNIVPDIPEIRVSSEKIDFDSKSIKCLPNNKGYLTAYWAYDDIKQPLYEIKGFGATLLLAKFLGNTDAKLGNIGIRRTTNDSGDSESIFTHLDSGCCFKVDPERYKKVDEIANPGWQDDDSDEVCNFLFQKADWSHQHIIDKFYADAAENTQVKRENRITALHIALLPEELYKLFATQYMVREHNPFLRNNDYEPNFFDNETSFDTVVNDHLVAKGQATFDSFIKDNKLFGYFLEFGETHNDNIFEIFQNFLIQLEGFHFYKKRDFNTVIQEAGYDTSLKDMLEERFINFIEKKLNNSSDAEKTKIENILNAWDVSHMTVDPRITKKDSIKGTAIAEKLRESSLQRSKELKNLLLKKIQDSKGISPLLQKALQVPRRRPLLEPLSSHTNLLNTRNNTTSAATRNKK